MSDLLLSMTGIAILLCLLRSYKNTRDPLSPLFAFAPMLAYIYVYNPWKAMHNPAIHSFFPNLEDIDFALVVNLTCITAFCIGMGHFRRSKNDLSGFQFFDSDTPPRVRRKMQSVAILMGTVANVAFWWLVFESGGPIEMFRKAKPFFVPASGYIGEAPMLTYPALLLLAGAWQGKRIDMSKLLIALYVALPQISWAIIGKRRGTIFLITAALVACWYLTRNRRPNFKFVLAGTSVLGMLLLYVAANRSSWNQNQAEVSFFGEASVEPVESATPQLSAGDEFVMGTGLILTSNRLNHHYWGSRFFVMYFIRPIPRILWPSKWRDTGFGSLQSRPGLGGMSSLDWDRAVGFTPTGGAAGGFVSDAFLEWSWGAVPILYGLGYFFSWLWKKWVSSGGAWTALYIEAMILSVHLPSQSLGSWSYRLFLMAVPTIVLFRILIPHKSNKPVFTPHPYQPPYQPPSLPTT